MNAWSKLTNTIYLYISNEYRMSEITNKDFMVNGYFGEY